MQEAAESELGGWRSAMDPMDERYDDCLDGDQHPPDQRDTTINHQGRENERSVLFFFVLFSNSFFLLLLIFSLFFC